MQIRTRPKHLCFAYVIHRCGGGGGGEGGGGGGGGGENQLKLGGIGST